MKQSVLKYVILISTAYAMVRMWHWKIGFTFNMPCVVALAATYQEIHSAKWTARIAIYYTLTALVLAAIVYHIGLLIW